MDKPLTNEEIAEFYSVFAEADECDVERVEPCGNCPEGDVFDGTICGSCGAHYAVFDDGTSGWYDARFRVAGFRLLAELLRLRFNVTGDGWSRGGRYREGLSTDGFGSTRCQVEVAGGLEDVTITEKISDAIDARDAENAALQAEVERLKEELGPHRLDCFRQLERVRADNVARSIQADAARKERDEARAEVERLERMVRTVVEELDRIDTTPLPDDFGPGEEYNRAGRLAVVFLLRAALERAREE
jgi:hypothetical protein